MSDKKYKLLAFLEGTVEEARYKHWLQGKARAHYLRDSLRGYRGISIASYKKQIHSAVEGSKGKDAYTGETLDWHLIGKYRNETSKRDKARSKLLPTVDHRNNADGPGFKICSWSTNDMKSDMSEKQLFEKCKKIIKHLTKK